MKTGIIVFAFGRPHTLDCNKHLASRAQSLAWDPDIKSIFTQRDISIENIRQAVVIQYVDECERPPSTLFMAEKSLEWAKKHGLKKVYILAALPHKWRCLRDAKKVFHHSGVEVEFAHNFDAPFHLKQPWFNKNSMQLRTRSSWSWWPREALLRMLPFFIYKRVAR